ncbi:hypothetical protein H6F67_20365 [Microcoleus sp. FACHB-1515]|uniref:hypothetical protein n=1 Tax=Cyanophyceae TaxID=3028117 RepID=UPI0016839E29|nr:hypothetical protein [Microcoleus sp. FACHB-1515]MBD2092208.1 hypothetical protein [Microcoleus sp. FACHB-1515]
MSILALIAVAKLRSTRSLYVLKEFSAWNRARGVCAYVSSLEKEQFDLAPSPSSRIVKLNFSHYIG